MAIDISTILLVFWPQVMGFVPVQDKYYMMSKII